MSLSEIPERFGDLAQLVLPVYRELSDAQDLADFAAKFLRDLRADDYPYLAEHVEQHVAAFGHGGESEFEFGLDLILDGLKRARGVA